MHYLHHTQSSQALEGEWLTVQHCFHSVFTLVEIAHLSTTLYFSAVLTGVWTGGLPTKQMFPRWKKKKAKLAWNHQKYKKKKQHLSFSDFVPTSGGQFSYEQHQLYNLAKTPCKSPWDCCPVKIYVGENESQSKCMNWERVHVCMCLYASWKRGFSWVEEIEALTRALRFIKKGWTHRLSTSHPPTIPFTLHRLLLSLYFCLCAYMLHPPPPPSMIFSFH